MSVRPASEYRALMEANAELRRERDHAREGWHRQNERADDYRRQLLDETERAEQLARAVNENADMIVTLRAEADELRRQLLNETYRPEGGEIVLRELRNAQRERDALRVKVIAVEALIDHARKISPSPSMHIYVADLERALGMDAPRPHKTGGNG